MPISRRRHTERTPDGEPLYIIETPNEDYEGRRSAVRFFNGVGKTKYADKAKMFSDSLGYTVKIHEDVEPWVEIKEKTRPNEPDQYEDSTYDFDGDEVDGEPVESYG